MKKKLLFLVLNVLSITSLLAQKNISINGTGFDSFQEVILKAYSHESLGYESLEKKSLGTEGSFNFAISFKGDNLYELSFDQKAFVHLSIPETSDIKVIHKEDGVIIEGSPNSVKMLNFTKQNGLLQKKYFGHLKAALDKAMNEGNQKRIDSLQQEANLAVQQFLVEFRALIVDMGANSAGFYALQFSDYNKELAFVEERLAVFQSEAPESVPTKALGKIVFQTKHTSIGKTPPNFNTKDRNGNTVTLDLLKGKIVLIDFWADWCRGCRIENPKIATLYETYKEKGFHVLSISQDVDPKKWQKAIEKDGIEAFQHVFDMGNKINDLYFISSLPQNILLDMKGKIIAKNVNALELAEILEKM